MTSKIPDTPAVRKARSRAHAKGDHSQCLAGRCEQLGGTIKTVLLPEIIDAPAMSPASPRPAPPDAGEAGRIEKITRQFVATLPYKADDPRHLLGELAIELAIRIDEGGAVPAAVGQLRALLMQLAEAPNGPPGVVDEMRIRHHQRQLDANLATLST